MILSIMTCPMKTADFVHRNIYMIFIAALLMNGYPSYSQQTITQKTTFGFHNGFYFPEYKIQRDQDSGDTINYILRDYNKGRALNGMYFPPRGWKISVNDSTGIKYTNPLCRIPEYSRSELDAMHKQQDLMWEQYYNSWRKEENIRMYSIDLESVVRGIK
jgi:hypothetical protein